MRLKSVPSSLWVTPHFDKEKNPYLFYTAMQPFCEEEIVRDVEITSRFLKLEIGKEILG